MLPVDSGFVKKKHAGDKKMDEVPVATSNPVNTIIIKQEAKPKPTRKDRIMETLKNFFLMSPLAIIIFIQFFYLGKIFGDFSTLTLTSLNSYIFIGSLALVLIFTQLMMRSIIYSTIAGLALTGGIFNAWFGDFITPVTENFKDIGLILKSAWSRKDIPFNLFVTGAMTGILFTVAFIQFLFALLTKAFFEMLFGKEWGDGKVIAYFGTIALLLGVTIGFSSYSRLSSNYKEKVIWSHENKFNPVEKFITRTPESFLAGKDKIYLGLSTNAASIEMSSGKILHKRPFNSAVVHKGLQFCDLPVLAGVDALYGFTSDLNSNTWKTPYPASFPELELSEDRRDLFNNIPLTTIFIDEGKKLLVIYDYGYVGLYDVRDGNCMWFKNIDLQIRANRVFPDQFLEGGHFLEAGNRLIFGCHNGLVKCFNRDSGELSWQYQHSTPKLSGKSQKALLTLHGNRLVAAYKSGEIITLDLENGRRIYQAANSAFSTSTQAFCDGLIGSVLTDEGIFYQFELDGGKILRTENVLPRKLDLVPVLSNLEKGIVAHRDEIIRINSEIKTVETIYKSPNQIFSTKPQFDEKIMYIGTRDGWIYCIHIGSNHEKWRIHVNGELNDDSLAIIHDSLYVKTTSGSIYRFNRNF